MSTIVYQSSSNESCFIEPRTLSLKLNSSKHYQTPRNAFQEISSSSKQSNNTCSSFSSIEALSSTKKQKEESVYVHPLVKQSSFMLSDKSLEMCTESLGSETGTCDMGSGVFFPLSTEERQPRQKTLEKVKKEVVVDKPKFPPPLTTMTGSNPLQVKPYRENGRLVIEAVSSPTIQSYMQAERSDGRLKLNLVSDDHFSDDDDGITSFDDEDDSFDGQIKDNFVGKDGVEENSEKEELEVWNESNAYLLEDDMKKNGKKVEFGVKLGMGKIQRPSRCKEKGQGNKRLINWEPFWVAT